MKPLYFTFLSLTFLPFIYSYNLTLAGLEVQFYVNTTFHAVNEGVNSAALNNTALRDVVASLWASLFVSNNTINNTYIMNTLDLVFAKQLSDGTFPWQFNENENVDPNSVQFLSLPLVRLLNEFPQLFTNDWLTNKLPNITLATEACYNEGAFEAFPYYTNIYTMRLVNLFLYYQITNNMTHLNWANEALTNWTTMIDTAGIHEFNSPTYSAVALANLYAGLGSIKNSTVQNILRTYIRYIQIDMNLHYFPPSLESTGAHSRDYDFIYGDAGLSFYYSFAGVCSYCNHTFGGGDWYLTDSDGITVAHLYTEHIREELNIEDNWLLQLACNPSPWKIIQTTYSELPGNVSSVNGTDRYTFIYDTLFALGSASGAYGPQDKLIVGSLGRSGGGRLPSPGIPYTGGVRLAQFTFVLDRFDSPYGRVDTPDHSGHEKPTHLYSSLSIVQDGAILLGLYDLSPELKNDIKSGPPSSTFTSIAANVLLPINNSIVDAIYVDGVKQNCITYNCPAVKVTDNVAVRSNGGLIISKIFYVDNLAGYTASSFLQFDSPNNTTFVGRYTSYLYKGQNYTFTSCPNTSRAGLIMVGGTADNDEDAVQLIDLVQHLPIVSSLDNNSIWNVTIGPLINGNIPSSLNTLPGYSSILTSALNIPESKIMYRLVNNTDIYIPDAGTINVIYANGTSLNISPHSITTNI